MSADILSIDTSKKFLSAADILESDDKRTVDINIPEWKGSITFRAMDAYSAMIFTEALHGPQKKRALVKLFQLCAIDQDGQPLFSPSQIERLEKKSWPVFIRLQRPLMELNGFGQPEKTLEIVRGILLDAGVDEDIIKNVETLWKADDEASLKND